MYFARPNDYYIARMKIYPFKALYPRLKLITDNDSFFGTAKQKFPEFVASGFYKKMEQPAYYIFVIQNNECLRTGIIVNTDIEEIKSKRVLPHEQTLASKEQNVMHLMLQRKAMIKPVLLGYSQNSQIQELVDKTISGKSPLFEVPLENGEEIHRYWAITSEEKIKLITDFFAEIGQVYIADGHHRCATSVLLYETNQIKLGNKTSEKGLLSAFIPFSDVKIYDFNRIVDLNHQSGFAEFIIKLSKYCKIKKLAKADRPTDKFTMTMFLEHNWYHLRWKKKVIRSFSSQEIVFDSHLFNELVIRKIMGIEDIRTTMAVTYKDGTKGTLGIENSVNNISKSRIGFCLPPMPLKEFKTAAEKGIFLPPKSTYFVPRIKNGMIIKEI